MQMMGNNNDQTIRNIIVCYLTRVYPITLEITVFVDGRYGGTIKSMPNKDSQHDMT